MSVDRYKMCHNPSDDSDIHKLLPAGLSKYVLNFFTDKSPPFHPTTEDVVKSSILVDIEKVTGHQLVRGRGAKLAVMYETHWERLSSITWEREIDLKNFSRHILARLLDVNSKTSEGRKLQVPCHARNPSIQSLLAPQEQVPTRTGIPSSVIQYLGKEIQWATSTASSFLLVEKPPRLVVGIGEGTGQGRIQSIFRAIHNDRRKKVDDKSCVTFLLCDPGWYVQRT